MPARATQRECADRLGIIRATSVYAWGTVDEAQQRLAHIRLTQQELRTIKSDLRLEMQHIRSDFTAQRAGVRANGISYVLRMASRQRTLQREQLRQKELKQLAPFEQLVREADDIMHALNRAKLDIDRWVTVNRR